MRKNKFNIIIYLIISIVIIIAMAIWICLFLGAEKGAEESWTIGVGLFGSLLGGLFTLIVIYITMIESQKNQREILRNNKLQALNYNIDNIIGVIKLLNNLITTLINIYENKQGYFLSQYVKQECYELTTTLQYSRLLLNNKDLEDILNESIRIVSEEIDEVFFKKLKINTITFANGLEAITDCEFAMQNNLKDLIEKRRELLVNEYV